MIVTSYKLQKNPMIRSSQFRNLLYFLNCVDEQVFGAKHDFVQVKHCVRNKYLKVCTLKKTSCKNVYFYVCKYISWRKNNFK